MFKRLTIACLNFLFPPLAVLLLTGFNEDVILNCVLFLLAIIPSHVHGFYISLTYFNRKRKVRRGLYPGKPRNMIWSDKVNNGGASRREMRDMLEEKEGLTGGDGLTRKHSRKPRNRSQSWNDGNSEKFVGLNEALSRRSTRRSRPYDEDVGGVRLSQRSSRRVS